MHTKHSIKLKDTQKRSETVFFVALGFLCGAIAEFCSTFLPCADTPERVRASKLCKTALSSPPDQPWHVTSVPATNYGKVLRKWCLKLKAHNQQVQEKQWRGSQFYEFGAEKMALLCSKRIYQRIQGSTICFLFLFWLRFRRIDQFWDFKNGDNSNKKWKNNMVLPWICW